MSLSDTINHAPQPFRLRAHWVLPIAMPPIENGEVVIEDGKITHVGRAAAWSRQDTHVVDLGNCALLPGLVNAHARLEQTVLRGFLEEMPSAEWMGKLTEIRAHIDLHEWTASATFGAAEMLAAGITTVADCSESGASQSALLASGQRGTVYREVYGMEPNLPDATVVTLLRQKIGEMRSQSARFGAGDRVRIGIAPHRISSSLLHSLNEIARQENLPKVIDMSGTASEIDIVWQKGGFDISPLAIHYVDIDKNDIARLLAKNVRVVHCPKANGKSGRGIPPLKMLREAKITVGLGTDSMAVNNTADLFDEMRHAIFQPRICEKNLSALSAKNVLEMATIGGAVCLHLHHKIGTLEANKRADICAVRLDGLHFQPTVDDDPVAAIVYGANAADVLMTMVDGRVLYEKGRHITLDVGHLRSTVSAIRARLRRIKGFDAPRF